MKIEIEKIEPDLAGCRSRKNYRFNCMARVDDRGVEFAMETNQPVYRDENGIFFAQPEFRYGADFRIMRIIMSNGFYGYGKAIQKYFEQAYLHSIND